MMARKRNKPTPESTLGSGSFPQSGNCSLQQMRKLTGAPKEVRQRLLAYRADAAFDTLVKANCDAAHLLILLADVARDGSDLETWEARFGYRPRKLRSVARRMRQCAGEIEVLDKNKMLRLSAWPNFKREFEMGQFFKLVASIPDILRGSAKVVEETSHNSHITLRALNYFHIALSQLIAYVQTHTGAPHDNETSALVNAVRKRSEGRPYTTEALKMWRNEHPSLIREGAEILHLRFGK